MRIDNGLSVNTIMTGDLQPDKEEMVFLRGLIHWLAIV